MDISYYKDLVGQQLSPLQLKTIINKKEFFEFNGSEPDSKEHAKLIDEILGFDTARVEENLLNKAFNMNPNGNMGTWGPSMHEGSQTWIGIEPQTLLTPYSELYEIIDLLKDFPLTHSVDLGAGYGRLAFIMQSFFPNEEIFFTGYEIVEERTDEANRVFDNFKMENSIVKAIDINNEDFQLPEANLYFIYDFSNPNHIKGLLEEFAKIYFEKQIFLVARGDGTRSLIQQKFPLFYSNYKPIHRENWSIYSSFTEIN